MIVSTLYTLLLMVLVTLFNVWYVSFKLKEHHIPLIFRNPDSNIYFDIHRAKLTFFMLFMVLSGILAQLNLYAVSSPCLHTTDEAHFSSAYVDLYQYALLALLWVVTVPLLFMLCMLKLRDNLKVGCYPIVVANIIFGFMLMLLSQIVIVYSLIYAENPANKCAHALNYTIIAGFMLNNAYYRGRYARFDV